MCNNNPTESCSSPGARILVSQSQSSLLMYSVVLLSVGQFDVDGQSFAPIGLHKTDAASDWFLIKWHCTGWANLKRPTASTSYLYTKGLPGVQLQNSLDSISYWHDFSINRKEDVKWILKTRGASEKFKNQPHPLFRPSSVNFCQHLFKIYLIRQTF
jgi:hypothetical protein